MAASIAISTIYRTRHGITCGEISHGSYTCCGRWAVVRCGSLLTSIFEVGVNLRSHHVTGGGTSGFCLTSFGILAVI